MAASLHYCTHSLADSMHAGFAHADATIITITPSPNGDSTASRRVDTSHRKTLVYFETGNYRWFAAKKQGCCFMVVLEIPNSAIARYQDKVFC